MELFMNLLLMLGGTAVFMYGMKQMSRGIQHGAGARMRNMFKKIDKNRLGNYGVGIGTTAIVQSSSATTIMTVGLANAEIVDFKQGAGIILGAKVGTTLTAFVFALSGIDKGGFNISAIFASLAFVGVYVTGKHDKLAQFLVGFGMLFAGLEIMEFAIGGSDSMLSVELQKVFQYEIMYNPILLVLLGVIFTSIIQSSTAATGLFLIFLTTGVIDSIDQAFFFIMGANIGTCTDGLTASIGTNANGRRVAVFHALTSTIGAVVFSVILAIFRMPIVDMFESVYPNNPQFSLPTFNLIYNTLYTLVLLALLDPMVALVKKLIKDKTSSAAKVCYIDDRLLATPAIAIEQALKEVANLAVMAQENFSLAFDGLIQGTTEHNKKISDTEYVIDDITRMLAGYFIKISSNTRSSEHEELIGGLHHVINDIERIGDYAISLLTEIEYMKQWDAYFLEKTKSELCRISAKISKLFDLSLDTFKTRKINNLERISGIHEEIIALIASAKDKHVSRLSSKMYSVEVSKSLYAVLFAMQRVADHIVNMGFSIRSNTGSKIEAFRKIETEKI